MADNGRNRYTVRVSETESEDIVQARRVMKLLELHHRHQRRLEQERHRLAAEIRQRVARLLGDEEWSDQEDGDPEGWPALKAATRLARDLPGELRQTILRKLPPPLEEEFLTSLYSFDAIPTLPSRTLQEIVRKAGKRELAISLLGAPDDYFHAITRSMSTRAAEMLKEDMEGLLASGELRTRDVQSARSTLSSVIRDVACVP